MAFDVMSKTEERAGGQVNPLCYVCWHVVANYDISGGKFFNAYLNFIRVLWCVWCPVLFLVMVVWFSVMLVGRVLW